MKESIHSDVSALPEYSIVVIDRVALTKPKPPKSIPLAQSALYILLELKLKAKSEKRKTITNNLKRFKL